MSFLFKRKEDGPTLSPSPTQSPTLPQAVPLHPQVSHGASATRSDQQQEHSRADSPSTARMPTFHTGSYNSCNNSAAGSLASSFVGGAASGLRVHAQGSSQPGTPPNELAVTRQSSVSSTSSNVAPHVPHSNPLIMATNRGPSGSVHHIYSTNVSLTPSSSLPSTPIHQSYMGSVPNISNELSFAAPPSGPLPAFPASLPLHPTAGMRASPPPNSTPPNMPLPVLHMTDSPTAAAPDMPDASNAPSDEVTAIRRMFSALPALSRSIFDLGATLGTGTFGRVRIVTYVPHASQAHVPSHVSPGQPMYLALKMLKKSEIIRLKQVEHIKAEKSILSRIAHPFIVNLYAAFQDERNLYMTMEYVIGGELFSQLRKVGRFSENTARFYAAEIVLALQYLHSKDIVYRDLKPENLLIDSEGHIKITDFGFAKVVEDRTWTLCGTPEYLAPEIIQSKGHGKAVDFWALGILIFEMLAGYPPFYDENPFGIYQKILGGKIDYPRHMDPHARDLIKKLLTADRTKRFGCLHAGAEDIKQHPWFKGVDWTAMFQRRVRPPFVPAFRAPNDTSNFDRYPDSREGSLQPVLNDKEAALFANF